MRKSLLFWIALASVFTYFGFQLSQTTPFLQHEIVGHSFWWNHPEIGFFETLFDGVKMDGWPGRFRYIEYLAEASYWKVMKAGLLPKDLYDFFGILSVFLVALSLVQTARLKSLTWFETFLCVAFFILSTNAFLISVFHFRKAKAVVGLLFALLLWISYSKKLRPHREKLILSLGIIGFFTDPFFILGAPFLVFGIDLPQKQFKRSLALIGGMSLGLLGFFLLNGVIGPYFNPNSQIVLGGFDGKHQGLLSLSHLPTFPRVLQELVTPGFILETDRYRELSQPGTFTQTSWVGWALVVGLTALLITQFRQKFLEWGFTLSILLLLPICAFLIMPISVRASYSGYYGYPFVIALTVFFMNFLLYLRTLSLKEVRWGGYTLMGLLIAFHQSQAREVFKRWVDHSIFPYSRERIDNDYLEIKRINTFLKENPNGVYDFQLDTFKVNSKIGSNIYFSPDRKEKRTDIAYFMIPLIFSSEIAKGRVRIVLEDHMTSAVKLSSNLPPGPSH